MTEPRQPWKREPRPLPTDARGLAPFVDHTLLAPGATRAEIDRLCDEALRHGFAGVCVNGSHVEHVARRLAGSAVATVAVVDFPLGAGTPEAKACEAADAVAKGARELDVVIDVGAIRSRDRALALRGIAAVVAAARPWPVKVILETSLLSGEEKLLACALAREAGAAFVKTSTGFGGGGATVEDVALMRRAVGEALGVKASGGIRTAADALRMLRAGADRLGASASVAIVEGRLDGGGG